MRILWVLFFIWLSVSFIPSSKADVIFSDMDKSLAFTVEGQPFTYAGYQQFAAAVAKQAKGKQDDVSILQGVIENRLLSLSILDGDSSDEDAHHEEHEHHTPRYVDVKNEYQQMLTALVSPPSAQVVQKSGFVLQDVRVLQESLSVLLKSNNSAKAMSHEAFDSIQQQKAKEIEVGYFQIAGGKNQSISYWDVYQIQSIQNKSKVRRGDISQIARGVQEVFTLKLHEHKVKQDMGLQDVDLSTIRQIISDKLIKQQYYLDTGIVMDLHHDQSRLSAFKSLVTDRNIEEYYIKNQSDFVQVGSVTARHITLKTQEDADRVRQKLDEGLSFAEGIKRFSISKDSGVLGFINRKDKMLTFVKKLALIQAVGKVSTPYRMLDGKSYEIILVDKKQPEPLPVTDKSVRSQIVNILAVVKAKKALEKDYTQWYAQRDIVINAGHFSAATTTLGQQ